METEEITVTTEPAQPETEPAPKPAWRAPALTRITLKRTMKGSGSPMDGSGSDAGTLLG